MILTKTPLRISFFGGGSDIPAFYESNEGMCISTTINSYIYLAVHRCVADHLKIIYSKLELEDDLEKIKHDRVRETLKHFGVKNNIEICSFSDIPVAGTGLGSSSTFTVGLVNAIIEAEMLGDVFYDKKAALAEIASRIEIEYCNEPIGKQDQYAAAYGGLNSYTFTKEKVHVQKILVPPETIETLEKNLLCFNTGVSRNASSVLAEQTRRLYDDKDVIDYTKLIVHMAKLGTDYLLKNKLHEFGTLLNDAWQIKKQLSTGVSNPHIDEMYENAKNAGALGGKILGAGGGGYLLLYVPENKHNSVKETMKNYTPFNFKFETTGSQVVYT